MDYSHCPEDVIRALDKFRDDVKSGVIIPWNPETRDEYCDVTAAEDRWIEDNLRQHLPVIDTYQETENNA